MKKITFKIVMSALSICALVLGIVMLAQHGVIALTLPAVVITAMFVATVALCGATVVLMIKTLMK